MNEAGGGSPSASPLGILGGTFDPVHFGHLRLAEEAWSRLGLGQVLWLPAGQPPLRDLPRTPATDRVAMVRLAIANNPVFALDTTEADAPEPSYSVNSLQRLRTLHGRQRPLVLLLGADAFARLEGWYCWRELFGLAHIAVATRPGHPQKVGAGETALDAEFRLRQGVPADLATTPAGRIVPFPIQPLDISATALRGYFASGESSRYLAPDAVLDYIHLHQLYCS